MLKIMYESPEIINRVGEIMRKPLPRAAEDIDTYVIELDAIRLSLAEAISDHIRLLYEKRKQALWPKDMKVNNKEVTELERQVRLNGDLAPIERDYEFLTRLERLVEQRINLGTILRRF